MIADDPDEHLVAAMIAELDAADVVLAELLADQDAADAVTVALFDAADAALWAGRSVLADEASGCRPSVETVWPNSTTDVRSRLLRPFEIPLSDGRRGWEFGVLLRLSGVRLRCQAT